jgi:hypothetical protein
MKNIPGDSFDSSDGRLIEAFDTEGGDFIKECAPMLEPIIGVLVVEQKVLPQLRHW